MSYQICCLAGISSSVFSDADQSRSWENIMISKISYVCYTCWILWNTAVLHLSFPARAWGLMKITALQSWQITWTVETVLAVMFLFIWSGTCKSISMSMFGPVEIHSQVFGLPCTVLAAVLPAPDHKMSLVRTLGFLALTLTLKTCRTTSEPLQHWLWEYSHILYQIKQQKLSYNV